MREAVVTRTESVYPPLPDDVANVGVDAEDDALALLVRDLVHRRPVLEHLRHDDIRRGGGGGGIAVLRRAES